MKQYLKEYIQSLIPQGYPDGNALVAEGRKMAERIPWNKSRFFRENDYKTWEEYCIDNHRKGKQTFQILMGLSTLEEQLDALKELEAFHNRTGYEVRSVQAIPSSLVALPREYWDQAPKPTSYLMEKEEDWIAQAEAAAVDICWEDWHLSSPNNLQETIHAVSAGTSRMGCFSQFIWGHPGWTDEKARLCDMCRSMGILAAKKDEGMTVCTYPEDGLGGYFMDLSSMLGYVMMEHYLIEDLFGARMLITYGGLLSEIVPRYAFGLACEKLYGRKDRMFVAAYNGSTNSAWDHDIEANYGIGAQEMLLEAVINRHYNMATAHKPVSITEALRVPTLEELLNITKCGLGVAEKAAEWEEIIDFTKFEKVRDLLIEKGTQFFQNMMRAFEEAGVNTRDPLELLTVLKNFDAGRLEMEFHPSVVDSGEFVAYVPTVLYNQTMKKRKEVVLGLTDKGYQGLLRDKKIVCVSADGHSYGRLLCSHVWSDLGARVVDGGMYVEPVTALDLADEEGTDIIAISLHNGQCLDYAKQLSVLIKNRNKKYHIVMGGVLNSMLPGYTEPIDVADLICEMGFAATNSFEEQAASFLRS